MFKLFDIYSRLLAYHGPQGWWPAETAFEILVGALLTQRTTWKNAARGIDNLRKKNLLNPVNLALASEVEIADCVRCTGFFRKKPRGLWASPRYLYNSTEGACNTCLRRLQPRNSENASPHGRALAQRQPTRSFSTPEISSSSQ